MDMARTKSDWCGASRPGRAACYAHSWSISGRSWSAVVVDRHDLRVRSKGIAIEAQRSCFDAARMLFVCCLYVACVLRVYPVYTACLLLGSQDAGCRMPCKAYQRSHTIIPVNYDGSQQSPE